MSYRDYDAMTQALQSSGTKIWLTLSTRLITNILLLIIVLLLLVGTLRPRAERYQWNHAAEKAGMIGVFDTTTGKLYLTNKDRTWSIDLTHEKPAAPQPPPLPTNSDPRDDER